MTTTKPHKKLLLLVASLTCLCMAACLMMGCSSGSSSSSNTSSSSQSSSTAKTDLSGKTLNIYCGAGMTKPFQEIADAFKADTGCEMNVTFANAAQIQTQIKTTQEGDFFIAGSTDELNPVKDYVASSTDLVKHIPVLITPSSNPKNVTGLSSLASCDKILIGDPESTPIGKIAQTALTKAGLWDSLSAANVFTTTTTAPQIATAIANGEGDAGIVWKENAKANGISIVETTDLDAYVKTVPSAQLTCAADADTASAFSAFLQTDTAKNIWTSYGYELV